jgi:hypothetical protein
LVTYIGGPFSSRLSDIAIDPLTFVMYAVSGSSQYFYTVQTHWDRYPDGKHNLATAKRWRIHCRCDRCVVRHKR